MLKISQINTNQCRLYSVTWTLFLVFFFRIVSNIMTALESKSDTFTVLVHAQMQGYLSASTSSSKHAL